MHHEFLAGEGGGEKKVCQLSQHRPTDPQQRRVLQTFPIDIFNIRRAIQTVPIKVLKIR
jgi:hypothetical protein